MEGEGKPPNIEAKRAPIVKPPSAQPATRLARAPRALEIFERDVAGTDAKEPPNTS